MRYLVINMNPVIQKTLVYRNIKFGEVNRTADYRIDAAGKGADVARVLSQLGEEATLLTHTGGRNADFFLELCSNDGIKVLSVNSGSEIRTCTTLIETDSRRTTEMVEEASPVTPGTERSFIHKYLAAMERYDMIIISGKKAAGYSDEIVPALVAAAKEKDKTVFLDVRNHDLINSLEFQPDFVKPNMQEFCGTFFEEFKIEETADVMQIPFQVVDKISSLQEKYRTKFIITWGKHGAFSVDNGHITNYPVEKIEPLNTTGCGDAFTAGFAFVWLREFNIEKACNFANECAAKNALILKPGVIR
ncbi:MAG: tagatose-6-phosphate kinase [Spirochaetes bacterium]|nr:tagatose-6-phosphate kinase [Spirochaetota bacterium]